MLIKVLVALAILAAMCVPARVRFSGISQGIDDGELRNLLVVADASLMSYYFNHAETLPEVFADKDVLSVMGLQSDARWNQLTYERIDDDQFKLTVKLSNGAVISSVHSNKSIKELVSDD